MRKKLTTYIEEDDIKKLKRLALEQNTSVADILGVLVTNHFNTDIVCIGDFDEYIDSKSIKYDDRIFEFDKYEDIEIGIKFYKNEEVICYIEEEFFEVIKREHYIEIIPIKTKDFVIIDDKFVKLVK